VNGNDAPTGGYVDEFDLDGRLVAHVGQKQQLDEPGASRSLREGSAASAATSSSRTSARARSTPTRATAEVGSSADRCR
jgi:hypothetical protein